MHIHAVRLRTICAPGCPLTATRGASSHFQRSSIGAIDAPCCPLSGSGINGVDVHITCGMKPHLPTDITSAALSVSGCGCYALLVLTACDLGAMHVHLEQKRSSQCSHCTAHTNTALRFPRDRAARHRPCRESTRWPWPTSRPTFFSGLICKASAGGSYSEMR